MRCGQVRSAAGPLRVAAWPSGAMPVDAVLISFQQSPRTDDARRTLNGRIVPIILQFRP
jgi:hypothetical protein